jgi:hypothetical protein
MLQKQKGYSWTPRELSIIKQTGISTTRDPRRSQRSLPHKQRERWPPTIDSGKRNLGILPLTSKTELLDPIHGTSIKFINNYWYNISWSKTFNSYYTESDQLIKEATEVGLGSLVKFIQVQETVEGKKHERQTSLSTQGSSKYPPSKRTKEGSMLRLTFSFLFLTTQQTHVTVYYYFLTRSCDSLVQIRTDDSFLYI